MSSSSGAPCLATRARRQYENRAAAALPPSVAPCGRESRAKQELSRQSFAPADLHTHTHLKMAHFNRFSSSERPPSLNPLINNDNAKLFKSNYFMLYPSLPHKLIGHNVSVPESRHAGRAKCPSDTGERGHCPLPSIYLSPLQCTHRPCATPLRYCARHRLSPTLSPQHPLPPRLRGWARVHYDGPGGGGAGWRVGGWGLGHACWLYLYG